MDGTRIREFWGNEAKGLFLIYKQFETLVPASKGSGADHVAEDGRFVEDLIRACLRQYLPRNLEVLTGFIVRPAVKTGEDGRERKKDKDKHSSQLDILVYDSSNYPIYQRFGDNVIVVPEGVIGIISIKKTLRDNDIANECLSLLRAGQLCSNIIGLDGCLRRGPFLALLGATSAIEKKNTDKLDWIFKKIEESVKNVDELTFDQLIGFVGALDKWSIFKKRPKDKFDNKAVYLGFNHEEDEFHLFIQYVLTGIMSVYYQVNGIKRPGFTAFPQRNPNAVLGEISVTRLR